MSKTLQLNQSFAGVLTEDFIRRFPTFRAITLGFRDKAYTASGCSSCAKNGAASQGASQFVPLFLAQPKNVKIAILEYLGVDEIHVLDMDVVTRTLTTKVLK